MAAYKADRVERWWPQRAEVLRVVDLRTGRAVRQAGSLLGNYPTQGLQDYVIEFVVSRTGGLAWIALTANGPTIYRFDEPAQVELAQDVDEGSLRLKGHRLSWTRDGVEEHARLG